MTAVARKALIDLEAAHKILEIESDAQKFRITWVAAMSLCRAIGHILFKVDAHTSPYLKSAIDVAWTSWNREREQNKIFHFFIDSERNAVLKEYEIGFMSGRAAFVSTPDMTLNMLSDELFCPLSTGPYEGEDCRDILAIAISWWHVQLLEIERKAAI